MSIDDSAPMYVFVSNYVEHYNNSTSNIGKNIATSFFRTLISNAITLPFGFASASISVQKKVSNEEMVMLINEKLYGGYSPLEVSKICNFLDPLASKDKTVILSIALNDQNKYRELMNNFLAKQKSAI